MGYVGDSKNSAVSKESIRNTRDQSRRQLKVLEEMQARKHEETAREPKTAGKMPTNNAQNAKTVTGPV